MGAAGVERAAQAAAATVWVGERKEAEAATVAAIRFAREAEVTASMVARGEEERLEVATAAAGMVAKAAEAI